MDDLLLFNASTGLAVFNSGNGEAVATSDASACACCTPTPGPCGCQKSSGVVSNYSGGIITISGVTVCPYYTNPYFQGVPAEVNQTVTIPFSPCTGGSALVTLGTYNGTPYPEFRLSLTLSWSPVDNSGISVSASIVFSANYDGFTVGSALAFSTATPVIVPCTSASISNSITACNLLTPTAVAGFGGTVTVTIY